MIFYLVRIITLNVLGFMQVVCKHYMTLSPTVLTLWYAWIHVCIPDGSYVTSYVKASVNQSLSFRTTLDILNIDLYYSHI